jgi:hypothetical protein
MKRLLIPARAITCAEIAPAAEPISQGGPLFSNQIAKPMSRDQQLTTLAYETINSILADPKAPAEVHNPAQPLLPEQTSSAVSPSRLIL